MLVNAAIHDAVVGNVPRSLSKRHLDVETLVVLEESSRRIVGEKLAVSNITGQHCIRGMPRLLANFPAWHLVPHWWQALRAGYALNSRTG
jgi:hypothetical protein